MKMIYRFTKNGYSTLGTQELIQKKFGFGILREVYRSQKYFWIDFENGTYSTNVDAAFVERVIREREA